MEKQTVETEFLGQKLVLKTEGDPSFVQEVVDLASLKVKEAEGRAKGAAPHQVALLAVMDLAEDYLRAKKKATDYRSELGEKASHLLQLIETELR